LNNHSQLQRFTLLEYSHRPAEAGQLVGQRLQPAQRGVHDGSGYLGAAAQLRAAMKD